MTDSEKLDLILQNMQSIKESVDTLELQMKASERTLRNEIKKSEFLILDEVERVHDILEKHTHDTEKHLV